VQTARVQQIWGPNAENRPDVAPASARTHRRLQRSANGSYWTTRALCQLASGFVELLSYQVDHTEIHA
jgi:hypothetical protein